jgi:hypothetical protein
LPIVIRPQNFKCSQLSRICFTNEVTSSVDWQPDLANQKEKERRCKFRHDKRCSQTTFRNDVHSSPDVFTCTSTFRIAWKSAAAAAAAGASSEAPEAASSPPERLPPPGALHAHALFNCVANFGVATVSIMNRFGISVLRRSKGKKEVQKAVQGRRFQEDARVMNSLASILHLLDCTGPIMCHFMSPGICR